MLNNMATSNWREIAAQIEQEIQSGRLTPGARLPSGDQLAKSLGVNRNAVHRAVEELQRRGLVVRRQGSGTIVATSDSPRKHRIALLVDGYSAAHNFPSGDLLRGIQDRLGDQSTLTIADSKHDVVIEARQLKKLTLETDGVLIYMAAPDQSQALEAILAEGFPIVAIDRAPIGVAVDSVMTDNFKAAYEVVKKFIEDGHRNIGFMGIHKPNYSSVSERLAGYEAALTEAGLSPKGRSRWMPDGMSGSMAIFGQLVRDTLFAMKHEDDPITAIFADEDIVGSALMVASEQLGMRTPQDFALATFNDWHPMTFRTPWTIHRIVQRKYELGFTSASLLLDRINQPAKPIETVRIDADIILADTSTEEAYVSLTIK